jgi:hypothetical protein
VITTHILGPSPKGRYSWIRVVGRPLPSDAHPPTQGVWTNSSYFSVTNSNLVGGIEFGVTNLEYIWLGVTNNVGDM